MITLEKAVPLGYKKSVKMMERHDMRTTASYALTILLKLMPPLMLMISHSI